MKISLQELLQGGDGTVRSDTVAPTTEMSLDSMIQCTASLEACQQELRRHNGLLNRLTRLHVLVSGQSHTQVAPKTIASLESVYSIIAEQASINNIVLPALESDASAMGGARLNNSLESIGAGIKRAVDYVIAAIRRLTNLFIRLIEQISPNLRMMRLKLYRLRQQANGVSGAPTPAGTLALGRSAGLYSTELAAPKSGAMVVRGLNEFRDQYSVVAKAVYDSNLGVAKEYTRLLESAPTGGDAEAWVESIIQLLQSRNPSNFAPRFKAPQRVSDPRWPAGSAVAPPPVVGQRSLVVVHITPASDKASDRLQAATDSGLVFTRLNPGVTKDYSAVQMSVMSYQEIIEAVKCMEDLLSIIEEQIVGGRRNHVKDVCRRLAAAAERAGGTIQADGALVTQAFNAVGSVTAWLANPYIAMTSHSISVISAHMRLVEHHLRAFEPGVTVQG